MQAFRWNDQTLGNVGNVRYLLRMFTKTGFPCDERAYGFGLSVALCKTPESSARMVGFIEDFVPADSAMMKDQLRHVAAHSGPVLVACTSEWMHIYLLDGDDPFLLWRRFLALEVCADEILEIERECNWDPQIPGEALARAR